MPAVESHNWLLHKYYTRHEYRICKKHIEHELAKSNGQNEFANHLKGIILRKEGRIQDSLECFEICYRINSKNVDNAKQIAKSLFLLGSHKRALDVFLEAEKLSAKPDWEIYHNIGECYARLNIANEGVSFLRKATRMTKLEVPYMTLARTYVSHNQTTDAMNVYTNALNNIPDSENIAIELGLLYLKMGDFKRAFQQFGATLAQSGTNVKALLPMAFIMQTHNEYDVALSKYKSASRSMSESWVMWNNVGMCFYGKQKFVAAISCLKRSCYLNPLAVLPACNLGIVLLTTGQPASAAIYLSAAVTMDANIAAPHLLLGLALKKLDETCAAEDSFARALALAPQDPLVLINYAVFLESEGKVDRAREMLTVLNDAITIVEIDSQITKMAKKLGSKLQTPSVNDENKSMESDEV